MGRFLTVFDAFDRFKAKIGKTAPLFSREGVLRRITVKSVKSVKSERTTEMGAKERQGAGRP